jgi:ankyrin repeat protein
MVDSEVVSAIQRDDVPSLKNWLVSGGDVHAVTAEGDSLLTLAARHGALGVVELLLREGTPPDAFGIWPGALVEAVEAGHEAVVARLIEAGADVGSEPWHEDSDLPLLSAILYRRWEIADRLLAAGAVAKADPLWLEEILDAALQASGRQRARFVATFLGQALSRFGEAPLPIEHRLLHKAATLLRKDPEARAIAERITSGVDVARALEEEIIDLYGEQERPDEALRRIHTAPPEWQSRLAAALLPETVVDTKWAMADELLSLAGRDVERTSGLGRTSLMYAAWHGNIELVKRLLELGARLRRADSTEEKSVMEWALVGQHAETIAYLEQRLRETAAAVDSAADARLAALEGEERKAEASRLAVEAASEGRWDRVEDLLRHGVDVNARGRYGRTLLMYAASRGDRKRVE